MSGPAGIATKVETAVTTRSVTLVATAMSGPARLVDKDEIVVVEGIPSERAGNCSEEEVGRLAAIPASAVVATLAHFHSASYCVQQ